MFVDSLSRGALAGSGLFQMLVGEKKRNGLLLVASTVPEEMLATSLAASGVRPLAASRCCGSSPPQPAVAQHANKSAIETARREV